ncbi:MAG TPA: sulfite exporter TauE/SafE family protein [Lacipirellula sp.]
MVEAADLLTVAAGGLVGLILGLVGGGGSIFAVPLLVYVVGVSSPHVAVGTSALAVAVSAASGLVSHARMGSVKWRCAVVFALSGIVGALAGAALGKAIDGRYLLALFGILMLVVGLVMLRRKGGGDNPDVRLNWQSARQLLPGLVVGGFFIGAFSGFFGIGGGFLIVPGLVSVTAMPLLNAIGSSLVSIAAFGLTTAASYAASDLIDWRIAAFFVAGGVLGGIAGSLLARRLASRRAVLNHLFAGMVMAVGAYVVVSGVSALI